MRQLLVLLAVDCSTVHEGEPLESMRERSETEINDQ